MLREEASKSPTSFQLRKRVVSHIRERSFAFPSTRLSTTDVQSERPRSVI